MCISKAGTAGAKAGGLEREWHPARVREFSQGWANESWQGSQFRSVQFSRSVVSDSLRPHELQHTRPPCPLPIPRVYSNSCPSSRWCHPAISSSVIPFSSCPQSLPASGSFPVSQLFAWGGQSTKVWSFSFSIFQFFQWTPRTDLL